MTSKAFQKLNKTIKRCEDLLVAYETLLSLKKQQPEIPAPKDMVRGAVVLAVSALDAYVTDVFAEKLVPYLKKFTPDDDLIQLLSDAGLDTREALNLIHMDRPYRRIRTLIEAYYATYTTQKFDVIDQMFLPYGLKDLTDNAEAKTGRSALKKSVAKLIDRRHDIAHGGDYNSHDKLKDINESQVRKRVSDVRLLVGEMDAIICNRI